MDDRQTDMGSPDVSIVIVSYNTRELLDRCLDSAFADSPGLSREIRVVDNASSDSSAAWVARQWPQVFLEVNSTNRGYAPACNQGLRAARGRWVLTLNSDAFLQDGALGTLVGYLEEHPEIAAAGPRILNADGTLQRTCARREPTFVSEYISTTLLTGYTPWLIPFARRFHQDEVYEAEGEIDVLSGACILFRREALALAGHLDERLVLTYDDIEWCLRARRRGLRLAYVPRAVVTHLGERSRWFDPEFNSAGTLQASAVFWDIRFPAPAALVLKLTMTANMVLSLAKNLVLAPFDPGRRPKVAKRLARVRQCLALLGRRAPRTLCATLAVACTLATASAAAAGTSRKTGTPRLAAMPPLIGSASRLGVPHGPRDLARHEIRALLLRALSPSNALCR